MEIFASVDGFFKKQLETGVASIFQDGVLFPLAYQINKNATKTIFFLPGAFNRSKSMPKFMRSDYFKSLNEFNCFSLFDPTLFLSDKYFSIGWFQGKEDDFYIIKLIELVKSIVHHLNIDDKNILFYGTSAGGIPCFNLAENFLGSNVFSGNIQTNALLFNKAHVDVMLSISYSAKTAENVFKNYPERVSIHHLEPKFNLFYAQNIADSLHYEKHFLPFDKTNYKGEFITYFDEKSGHNPLPRDHEIEVVKSILYGNSIEQLYNKYQ